LKNLIDQHLFNSVYEGKRVFVTGHTGFKGSWMTYWLTAMGAKVKGYSLPPNTEPAHADLLLLDIESVHGDIRDAEKLKSEMHSFKPDIVFHMAAQPLVRYSYREPHETFETNVMGSLNLYEACRNCDSVKSIVSLTTDKVYENKEWVWGYRETDRLGGKDPYSASKAAMEIMTNSYRHSYFGLEKFEIEHDKLLAVGRAGNVIGGGDWAQDRLIPDFIRAALNGEVTEIRSPEAVRPWQHVLDPLSGYLLLGQKLIERNKSFHDAFNFGPLIQEELSVGEVANIIKSKWDKIDFLIRRPDVELYESTLLKLDCSKALKDLSWKPTWSTENSITRTIEWYKSFYENKDIKTGEDLNAYISAAKSQKAIWCLND
tara:strand:- start:1381 stop:2499 length:1119 start_codon:yes stop_codon:yes gene_type:complete